MIGKLVCWWKGKHKRGKPKLWRGPTLEGTDMKHGEPIVGPKGTLFECPRCKATWTRPAKKVV